MKPFIYTIAFLFFISLSSFGQQKTPSEAKGDTIATYNLGEIVVSAIRSKTPLREVPAAISVVNERQLTTMSKSIEPDEALRLVPGVRVENGTDGSRVHLYIRGQGVLSESGFRGIQVIIDGLPVNDPGGYCPDLYDVDWETVKSIEVVKGLSASMYGGSANGGIVNINTFGGGQKPVNVTLFGSGGSYGFMKTLAQVDGTKDNVNYRISYSHTQGNGYRFHQAFMGDNFSEKLKWTPSNKVSFTQILTYTNYFNQNSEGINLGRYDTVGYQAANTDAIPYNEFHLTQRLTGGFITKFNIGNNQDFQIKSYLRINNYRETSNNGDDYKPFVNPGLTAQYDINMGKENLINHISLGADFQTLTMNEHEFGVPDEDHIDHNRIDSHFSMQCFDTDAILINQRVRQKGSGVFFIDKLDISKKLYATLNVRYDNLYNELINNIPMPDSLSSAGSRTFTATTYRFGLAYDVCKFANIYANAGTGFLMPTNDELYNNPVKWGGFNTAIKPSTSMGGEFGIRGDVKDKLHYDITYFMINTSNEFYRYSIPDRGNNTAFFGNMGKSSRNGLEAFISYSPIDPLTIDLAYTYSDFKYTSPDSVKNHWIPECPQNMLTAEVSVRFLKHLTLSLNTEYQSKWYIQVDDSIYNQFNENGVLRNSWVDGYNIFSANLKYDWKIGNLDGDISLFAKNLTDEHYFGFTEPNNGPDYNSFQPAPGREFFVSLKLRF